MEDDEQIIITGDNKMRLVKTITLREGDAQAIYDDIASSAPMETPLLPVGPGGGTLAYAQRGTVKIFWMQQPECLVNVEANGRIHTLAWPWALYGVIVERFMPLNVCMYWTKGKITSPRQHVYYTALPNVMENERLCMGHSFREIVPGATSYDEVLQRIIHWIHTASFNDHIDRQAARRLCPEIVEKGRGAVGGYRQIFSRWEKWTQDAGDNWRDINNLNWQSGGTFDAVRKGFLS
jgi:hypothetical protein